MTSVLMVAPSHLEQARGQLQNMDVDGQRETSRLMALAECNFRLAVHPETGSTEAVRLLQEAIRIDGANPKYAYHLGRIYYLRGEFTSASRWFRLACCLAPTSHRIWGHVAVLLHELDAVYHGVEKYEANVLRQRAEAISSAIREGKDNIDPDLLDFVPPKSQVAIEKEARQGNSGKAGTKSAENGKEGMRPSAKVRRYLNACKCRWAGVDHLFIEHTLEGRPTQTNLRKLLPVLEDLSGTAASKPGLPAAVTILCIQWMLSGYPVESIRRIMGALPEDLPSTDLLEIVCQAFEAPVHEVPHRLASLIQGGRIPPLVASLIHRQRCLWHPLEFRSLGTYRAARQFVGVHEKDGGASEEETSERDEAARDLTRRLNRAIASLDCEAPTPLKDHVPKTKKDGAASSQSLVELFEGLEQGVATLVRIKDESFRLIKEGLDAATKDLSDAAVYSQSIADRDAVQEFLTVFQSTIEVAMKRCNELSEVLPTLTDIKLPDDFAPRSQGVISALQSASNLGKFAKVLKRIDKRIGAGEAPEDIQQRQPAAEWFTMISAVSSALPDESASDSDTSIDRRLTELESAATTLKEVRASVSDFLRTVLDPTSKQDSDASVYSQAVADYEFLESLLTEQQRAAEQGLQGLTELGEAISETAFSELPQGVDVRLEEAANGFRDAIKLGSLRKRLRRVGERLELNAERLERETLAPSAPLPQLQSQVRSALAEKAAESSSSDRDDPISAWLAESTAFLCQFNEGWGYLKDYSQRHQEGELTDEDLVELNKFRASVGATLQTTEQRLGEIGELRQLATVAAEDIDRLDMAETYYLKVLTMRGKFFKRLSKLPNLESAKTPPNKEAGSVQDATEKNSTSARKAEPPLPPKPLGDMSALEQLQYALARTDWSVRHVFGDSLQTLEPYPQWVRMLPPFDCLRRRIEGQMAETFYRLGRKQSARRIWNGMLRVNRLDAGALKNMAVCDTVTGDVGRSLTSWREYLELLYLFDVLTGAPSGHATVRVEFHRAFGNAYAPGFLSAKFDHEWKDKVDPASLISFLSSPGRFRCYIEHRLLEYLNARFEFTSPSLILGIKRVEAESCTDDAEKTMVAFAEEVAALIPGETGQRLASLAIGTFREAAKRCRKSQQLTLQATPEYEEEEKRQIELLGRMFDLKIKLVIAFREHVDMVKNITSFDFLRGLSKLDTIPLQISPGLVPIVAHTLQIEEEVLLDLTSSLRQNVILALIEYLLSDDDEAERPIRTRQYELLTGKWLHDKEFAEFAQHVDTPPPQLMPQDAAEAITGEADEPALKYLYAWHDQYPAMGGLAVMIANRLIKRKEFAEARTRLEKSRAVAFYEPTRRHINYLLVQILIRQINPLLEDENYEEALPVGIEMVEFDDFQPALVCQTLDLYVAVSLKSGHKCHEKAVTQAVDEWTARATQLSGQPDDDNGLPNPTEKDVGEVSTAYSAAKDRVRNL